MTGNYLMVDPRGRFYQSEKAGLDYHYSYPIHEVGVEKAIRQIKYSEEKFSQTAWYRSRRKNLRNQADMRIHEEDPSMKPRLCPDLIRVPAASAAGVSASSTPPITTAMLTKWNLSSSSPRKSRLWKEAVTGIR